MSIMETIKAHPGYTIGGILAIGLIVIYMSSGSSGGATATPGGPDPGGVAAATALQAAQLQAQGQIAGINASVQANQDTIAGQLALAKIQGDYSTNNNNIAANVSIANINATQQTQSYISMLAAGVQNNTTNANRDVAITSSNNQVAQEQILADALVKQSTNQTQLAMQSIQAQQQLISQKTSCTGIKAIFGGC